MADQDASELDAIAWDDMESTDRIIVSDDSANEQLKTLAKSELDAQFALKAGTAHTHGTSGLDDEAVTNAKLAHMAQSTIKGRAAGAGTGDATDLTATQARTILNVEDGADVTDATNVAAAGAVMSAGTDASGFGFVLDEDNFASNSDAHVPTQQSTGAFIATSIANTKLDDLAAPDDNTDLDATTSAHGLLPKLGGGTTDFLRADGAWAAPPGASGGDSWGDPVDASIIPDTDDTYDLGAGTAAFATGYFHDLSVGTAITLGTTVISSLENGADVTDSANVNAAGAVMESDYDAQTILAAVTDNTPVALTVGTNRVVGRMTGNLTTLTGANLKSLSATNAWSDPLDTDIIPDGDDTRTLGAGTARFTDGHFINVSASTAAIKLDNLAAPDDNTDLNATTGAHGLLPKLAGGTSTYLRADGTWATPPSSGLTWGTSTIQATPGGTDTPAAVTIGVSQFVGRGANEEDDIAGLSMTDARTLLNVEDGADVTDATNVDAAGAVMESDYGGQSLLLSVSVGTPVSTIITANSFVGRAAGDVGVLNASAARSILNVEDGADVTDATNVDAAGATMNTDMDVSGNSWVLDEDNFSSDSNTKVPTQQSTKAYVDTAITAASASIDAAKQDWYTFKLGDESTDATTGTKVTWYAPADGQIHAVNAGATAAGTGSATVLDVEKNNTTIIAGTSSITLDAGANHISAGTTAAPVLASDPTSFSEGDKFDFDVDTAPATAGGAGLHIDLLISWD